MNDPETGIFVRRFPDVPAGRHPGSTTVGRTLAGLAVAVKDVISTAEAPPQGVRLGSAGDATAVARLRRAGAFIAGKTTTTELALGTPEARPGSVIPRNPWNADHWAGGSSSGSAIAVAVGLAFGALGTDTAGSIRVPAAYCGVTGLMPTYGRVPVTGVLPLAFSIDRIGPMARTARGCARLLGVIAGHDSADPASSTRAVPDYLAALTGELKNLRIGVCGELAGGQATADVADPRLGEAFAEAVSALESLGAQLTDITLPYYAELTGASAVIMLSEALAYHLPELRADWARFGRSARTTLATAVLYSAADYVQAQRVRRAGRRALAALFADVDLIVTPTAQRGAPTVADAAAGGGSVGWGDYGPICTPYWSIAGCPAISVPMGMSSRGLSLGLQIAGRPFDDAIVLRAADAFQRRTAWHRSMPPSASAAAYSGRWPGQA